MNYSIKPSNELRTQLYIEDLYKEELKTLAGFGLVRAIKIPVEDGEEEVLILSSPIPSPDFRMFYASKITSNSDGYLPQLIMRLLYLHPNPSKKILKLITQHIIVHYGAYTTKESKVTGKPIDLPVLTFEGIYPSVCAMDSSGLMKGFVPDSTRVTLFSKSSKISPKQRREISKKYRLGLIHESVAELIHQSAEYLNDANQLLKITKSRIAAKSKDLTVYKTAQYMAPRTARYIEEANMTKYFNSERTVSMYSLYLAEIKQDPNITSRQLVQKLNISHSSITEFRKISSTLVEI